MADKYEPRALLEFGSSTLMLPADKAVAAFNLLCSGEPVRYDWDKKGYKREKNTSSNSGVTLRTFSVTDYASLALNSADE
jgi:hypothetical protein